MANQISLQEAQSQLAQQRAMIEAERRRIEQARLPPPSRGELGRSLQQRQQLREVIPQREQQFQQQKKSTLQKIEEYVKGVIDPYASQVKSAEQQQAEAQRRYDERMMALERSAAKREQAYESQQKTLSDLKKAGFEPVIVNGQITGYVDTIRGKSIPAENMESYISGAPQPPSIQVQQIQAPTLPTFSFQSQLPQFVSGDSGRSGEARSVPQLGTLYLKESEAAGLTSDQLRGVTVVPSDTGIKDIVGTARFTGTQFVDVAPPKVDLSQYRYPGEVQLRPVTRMEVIQERIKPYVQKGIEYTFIKGEQVRPVGAAILDYQPSKSVWSGFGTRAGLAGTTPRTIRQIGTETIEGFEKGAYMSGKGWEDIYRRTISKLPESLQPKDIPLENMEKYDEIRRRLVKGEISYEAARIQINWLKKPLTAEKFGKGVETSIRFGAYGVPIVSPILLGAGAIRGVSQFYDPKTEEYITKLTTPEQYDIAMESLVIGEGERKPSYEEWIGQVREQTPEIEKQIRTGGLIEFGMGAGILGTVGLIKGFKFGREPIKVGQIKGEPTYFGITIPSEKSVTGLVIRETPKRITYYQPRWRTWIKQPIEFGAEKGKGFTTIITKPRIDVGLSLIPIDEKGIIRRGVVFDKRVGGRLYKISQISGKVEDVTTENIFGMGKPEQDIFRKITKQKGKFIQVPEEGIIASKGKFIIMERARVSPSAKKIDLFFPYKDIKGVKTFGYTGTKPISTIPGYEVFPEITGVKVIKGIKTTAKGIIEVPGVVLRKIPKTEKFGELILGGKKTPLSKTFQEQVQKVTAGAVAKLPRIRTTTPKVIPKTDLSTFGFPSMVGGVGQVSDQFWGKGEYETTDVGVVSLLGKTSDVLVPETYDFSKGMDIIKTSDRTKDKLKLFDLSIQQPRLREELRTDERLQEGFMISTLDRQLPRERMKERQTQKELQKLSQLQRQQLRQRTTQIIKPMIPRPTSKPKPKPRLIPPIIIPFFKGKPKKYPKTKQLFGEDLFLAEVKEVGKKGYKPLGIFTEEIAKRKVKKGLFGTLAASGRIVPLTPSAKEKAKGFEEDIFFRPYKIRKGEKIRTPFEIIQKKKKRLVTGLEVRQIQQKRKRGIFDLT